MSFRVGLLISSVVVVVLAIGGSSAWWVLRRDIAQKPEAARRPIPVSPAPQATPAARISTIIDLPGDPALVRRAEQKTPRPLALTVASKLTPGALKEETQAFYVSEPLTPAAGGYLGKFTGNGQEANALNAELAMSAAQSEGGTEDTGDDDDGGDAPANTVQAAPLTGANSQQLDAIPGGENGKPQIKQSILRPKLAQKIADLLVESGFDAASAADVEAAAKRLYNIQTLRVGAVGLAVGAIDTAGVYRVKQLALFQDGEYVGTVAISENGSYGEGAEPQIPQGLLDNADTPPLGAHFDLADGVYSAGLRSAVPEPVIREAVHLLAGLGDLNAALATGETLRLIYARSPRAKGQGASRVIYAGLTGPAMTAECYAFEMNDGGYRCFSDKEAQPEAVPLPPSSTSAPLPPSKTGGSSTPADSGAAAVGGLLAPIRGAPITSLFGMRFHPILHITRLHAGIDFGAAVGSQVRAAADGVVDATGEARGYGSRIVLKHGGYETTYNHLSEIRVSVGAKVTQGEIIALSGNSGLSTGPHLHFEYRINGEPNDPMPHMGKEVQARAPSGSSGPAFTGASVPVPPTPPTPSKPDPAVLAAFALAKADVDAALAEGER